MSTPDALALKAAIEWAERFTNRSDPCERMSPCYFVGILLAAARQSRTAPNADCVKAATIIREYVQLVVMRDVSVMMSTAQANASHLRALASRLEAMGTAPEHELIAEIDVWLRSLSPESKAVYGLLTRCRTALAVPQRMQEALKWYEQEAVAIGKAMQEKPPRPQVVMAAVTVLSLDSGNRARAALAASLQDTQ